MPFSHPIVLVLSANPGFARAIATRWPADANAPEFTVLDQGLFHGLAGSHYDLAIADAASGHSASELRQSLTAAGKPAILIRTGSGSGQAEGNLVELWRPSVEQASATGAEPESWATTAGLIGREILRRGQAEARALESENLCVAAQAEATLGRYMVEMRHNVNNALTSVLGNAELLAVEPGLPADALAQADTVRNMALRLHEVFQRFSSLEKELSVAARESGKAPLARAAFAGR